MGLDHYLIDKDKKEKFMLIRGKWDNIFQLGKEKNIQEEYKTKDYLFQEVRKNVLTVEDDHSEIGVKLVVNKIWDWCQARTVFYANDHYDERENNDLYLHECKSTGTSYYDPSADN